MFARTFVLTLVMIAAPAAAQTAAKIPAVAPSIPRASFISNMDGEFARMDANKDGKLTKQEIEAYQHASALQQIQARNRAVFAALDTDHNGQLSPAEFAKFTAVPAQPNAAPMLQRFDSNKDGVISVVEYRAGTLANFDKLDADKDGTVSPAEMRAAGIIKH